MTIDQLSLYNNALMLVGERPLATLTDAIETRYRLDVAYNQDAVDSCLSVVKPNFASARSKLTASSTLTGFNLAEVCTLPSDYVDIVVAYSDVDFDTPIKRHFINDLTIESDFATVYLWYITNSISIADWSSPFADVVTAYLAIQIAPRFAPQKLEELKAYYDERLKFAIQLDGVKADRPIKASATLSDTWRAIYNDALMILGLPPIVSNDDDSERRAQLDIALGTGVVKTCFETTAWTFGITADKVTYDPSLEPGWGYRRVFAKPNDMVRFDGIWSDEYFTSPIKLYEDDNQYWYTDVDTIYIKYVKSSFLSTPSAWPQYFTNLVAAELAMRAGNALKGDMKNAAMQKEDREARAESQDAMAGPPLRIAEGSWSRARRGTGRQVYDGRP